MMVSVLRKWLLQDMSKDSWNLLMNLTKPNVVQVEMVKTFKITRSTLDRALKYKGNSARDNMLRKAAFQRGGVIYLGITAPKGYLPDVDTTFENGCMRQKFGHRIEVVVHLESNRTTIHIDGQKVASFDDLTVSTWGNMLYSLQTIYNRLADPHPASLRIKS
jgi:hypothetical protein